MLFVSEMIQTGRLDVLYDVYVGSEVVRIGRGPLHFLAIYCKRQLNRRTTTTVTLLDLL